MKGNTLKYLVVGLGSIGRRHLMNLHELGCKNLFAVSRGSYKEFADQIPEVIIYSSLGEALTSEQFDAIIIANPTSLHLETSLAAAKVGSHLLIEKPVSHDLRDLDLLEEAISLRGLKCLIGFQFRFHPFLQKVKNWLDEGVIGKVLTVSAHWGEYLPNWHPWEDYRKGYSAKQSLGGGVINTLSHPIDYLIWMLGDITSVSAIGTKVSRLEIDVEDLAMVLLDFKSGVKGHLHLNYFEQPASHEFKIIGEKGKILWNNENGSLKLFKTNQEPEEFSLHDQFERNTLFLNELRHFIQCIAQDKEPICPIEQGITVMEVIEAIKTSSDTKSEVIVGHKAIDILTTQLHGKEN